MLVIVLTLLTVRTPAAFAVVAAVVAVMVILPVLFSSMTVAVDEMAIRLTMLHGRLRRTWPVSEVSQAEIVRVPWRYGLGIHGGGRTWVFNVSGRAAVSLWFSDGTRVMLGSDEPERLLAAVNTARLRRRRG